MNNLKKYLNHVLKDIFFSYEKRLDKLDLGENFISSVPQNMFNNTLSVNDLNLDYNYIESLQENAFKSISPRRIYLGMNRIRDIHPDAFSGLETTLELLDLERNSLNNVSRAFDKLQNLRYLYLSNNNISSVREDSFLGFGESLRALSLSGNLIRVFPRAAVRACTKLSHLNIGYNDMAAVTAQDFMGWADSLDTLILRCRALRLQILCLQFCNIHLEATFKTERKSQQPKNQIIHFVLHFNFQFPQYLEGRGGVALHRQSRV